MYGFPRKNQNDFLFSRTLDYKLLPLIQQHAANKPVLVFCATRKGMINIFKHSPHDKSIDSDTRCGRYGRRPDERISRPSRKETDGTVGKAKEVSLRSEVSSLIRLANLILRIDATFHDNHLQGRLRMIQVA